MNRDEYLSTGEAAEWLNISRSTVSRKYDAGELKGKVNPLTGERLISRESVLALMKDHDLPVDVSISVPKKLLLGGTDASLQATLRTVVSMDPRLRLTETTLGADTLISCSMETPDLLILSEEFPDIACGEVVQSLRRRQEQMPLKILCCLRSLPPEQGLQWGADCSLGAQDWVSPQVLLPQILRLIDLSHIETSETTEFEHRRRWPRYAVSLPARAGIYLLHAPRHHAWGTAVVRNISQGGAYLSPLTFEGASIPAEPFRLMLEIDQPPIQQWRAYCQIVRLQSNGQLSAGLQFIRLSRADRAKIRGLTDAALVP